MSQTEARYSSLYNKLTVVIIVVTFSVVSSMLWIASHAATDFLSAEPEAGNFTAPAVKVTDASASGGVAVQFPAVTPTPAPTPSPSPVSSTTPCVGAVAPAQWKHVVVLMFENTSYPEVTAASSPWINSMQTKCGSYAAWKDSNFKVTGASDGNYISKPSYATLTSGVPPSVHGMLDDAYTKTSTVDNIFNRLYTTGKTAKVYQSGGAGSCATSNFSGAYHDPLRYYTNLGAQSSAATTLCNQNDKPIADFMTDVNAGTLPAYSMILPTNQQNMHDNSIASGDAWAKALLVPFLDSARYKSGDTALFFLWDEDTPIPNVFMAPSIKPGTKPVPTGTLSFSHFSALRTWQEMLSVTPLLGDTGQAPSMLNYYNGQ